MRNTNDLLAAMGSDYCLRGQCPQAISAWELLLQKEPRNPDLHYRLGRCFSGGCRQHALVDTEIALEHFRSAAQLVEHRSPPLVQAVTLDALGQAYYASSRYSAAARLLAAIDCTERAADLYLAEGRMEDWAREQSKLGLAKCELPEQDYPSKWSEAIDHFKNALWVRRPEKDPEERATTLLNLGTAYRSLGHHRVVNVCKAIDCYRRALRFFRLKSFPKEYADLHNNLGDALLSLPLKNQPRQNRNTRNALRHFDQALRCYSKTEHSHRYARTQFNRGQALLQLKDADIRSNREQAETCFREAAETFSQCGDISLANQAEQLLWRTREQLADSGDPGATCLTRNTEA